MFQLRAATGPAPRCGGDERGAVAVLVALMLPVFILFLSFVVDIGNAFYHHRHLQTQADAAALAGGLEFNPSCSDADIVGRAFEYSGIPSGNVTTNTNWTASATAFSDAGAPFNAQIGGTAPKNVYEAINSQSYLPSGNPAPRDPTTFTGSPCQDDMLDVKMTETNLPWYFQAGGLSYLSTHARVNWSAVGGNFLPLAVAETRPVLGEAYFVDESNGNVLAQTPLTDSHSQVGGSGPYATDEVWTSPTAANLSITASDIGVVIALSGDPNAPLATGSPGTVCAAPLVSCYNQPPTKPGDDLVHIRGFADAPPNSGSPSKPVYRSVTLSQPPVNGCTSAAGADSYAPYYSVTTSGGTSCDVQLNADVDLGANPQGNPQVTAVNKSTGKSVNLAELRTSTTWTGFISLPAGSGPNDISLKVCSSGGGKKSCTPETPVQVAFAANDSVANGSSTNSGPIDSLALYEGPALTPTYSVPECDQYTLTCTHQISVTADIAGSIKDQTKASDPVYELDFSSTNTSSQTGTLVCPPGNNSANVLAATLISGCPGTYSINCFYSQTCNTPSDPGCLNMNPIAGGSPPPPADCVQGKNGFSQGPVGQAIYDRFVNGAAGGTWHCPNQWDPTPSGNYGANFPDRNDSRIITLYVVPFGSFTGSGALGLNAPILDGATFYVSGWDVPGASGDPCTTDPPPPGGAQKGQNVRLWGHFLAFTDPKGKRSSLPCKASALGACVVSLTQ